jgi:hypothetical protein
MTGNSSSLWMADETLLFLQCDLDPTMTYNITVTVNDPSPFSFDSFTVYQQTTVGVTDAPPPSHRNNQAGIIAGSVISGIAFLTLMGCCCACYLRNRTYTRPKFPSRRDTNPKVPVPPMMQGLHEPVVPPNPIHDHRPIPYHHNGSWTGYEVPVIPPSISSRSSSEPDSPISASPPPITIQMPLPPLSHDQPVVLPSPNSFSDSHSPRHPGLSRINQDLPPIPAVRGRSRTPPPPVVIISRSRSRTPSRSPVRHLQRDAREGSHSNLSTWGTGLRQGGRGSAPSTPSTRTVNTPVDPPAITLTPWISPNGTRPMIYQVLSILDN